MQAITAKQAAFTVTITDPSGVESFYYYDGEVLGTIVQALYAAQADDQRNR